MQINNLQLSQRMNFLEFVYLTEHALIAIA